MNKRTTSLLLCLVMVLTMLAVAVPAFAAGGTCVYTIEADKATASPGDTVSFTVYMQQTGLQNTLEGTLTIPAGLTYVPDSAEVDANAASALNWTKAMEGVAWTEESMMFNGFGSVSFDGTQKVTLLKFQCTVDSDAAPKDYEVTLTKLVADDEDYMPKEFSVVPAKITVGAAETPHTHSFGEWTQTKAPTCIEKGEKTRTCACGETEKQDVAVLDHNWATTWESDETNHWHGCSHCDAKNDTAAHTPGEEATETTPQTCTVCGYVIQAALGHTHSYGTDWKNDETNHWHECSCGEKAEIAAHTWAWETDLEPTANSVGYKHEECTVCHRERSNGTEIPAIVVEPETYTITAVKGTAYYPLGTVVTEAAPETEVTITANAPESGKVFDKWVVNSGDIEVADATSETTTFTMPANAVEIEATYKNAPTTPGVDEPIPAQFAIEVTKVIEGDNAPTDAVFTFKLLDNTGLVVDTTNVTGAGSGSFAPLTFVAAGTYSYTVTEVTDGMGDWEYDDSVVNVAIKVIAGDEDSEGNPILSIGEVIYTVDDDRVDGAIFTNIYDVDQPGDDQPGDDQPGDDQPGDDQPGDDQPGDDQPGDDQPGDDQPGDDQPGDDQPQTGDTGNIFLWLALMAIAGAGIIGTTVVSKKRRVR